MPGPPSVAVVACEFAGETEEPASRAVQVIVEPPAALPLKAAVVDKVGRHISTPALGTGGPCTAVVVNTCSSNTEPQALLTVQRKVYAVFTAIPLAIALGVLAFGLKLTPAEGVTVQVPVSVGPGVFAAKRTLPAQIVASIPVVATVGTALVTFTSTVSVFAAHVLPPEELNLIL